MGARAPARLLIGSEQDRRRELFALILAYAKGTPEWSRTLTDPEADRWQGQLKGYGDAVNVLGAAPFVDATVAEFAANLARAAALGSRTFAANNGCEPTSAPRGYGASTPSATRASCRTARRACHNDGWPLDTADAGGGALALIEHVNGCDKAGALAWLVDAHLIDPPAGPGRPPAAPRRPGGTSPHPTRARPGAADAETRADR